MKQPSDLSAHQDAQLVSNSWSAPGPSSGRLLVCSWASQGMPVRDMLDVVRGFEKYRPAADAPSDGRYSWFYIGVTWGTHIEALKLSTQTT